jgi:branched-subunit amino acid ABC-type transport system permease component
LQRISLLFDTSDFPARWTCGSWSSLHGWTHVIADLAIFGAYLAIPLVLAFFVLRRRDLPFLPIFWLFAAFILSCGIGHLIEATIFWHPWYRLSALLKVCTALASWGTVIALVRVIPGALALPGMAALGADLQKEVSARRRAESLLQEHADRLQQENSRLESFASSIVGREERVVALKREVNALLSDLSRPVRYPLAVTGAEAAQA